MILQINTSVKCYIWHLAVIFEASLIFRPYQFATACTSGINNILTKPDYLAAILNAILIFSKCSMMTGCHQPDSSMATQNQQELVKKKL